MSLYGQANRNIWPPHPPYGQFSVIFCVCLTLEYEKMFSETDFTQEESFF